MSGNKLISTTIAAAVAIGLSASATTAVAAGNMEKCYGVAKAGKNDCAANGHACAGLSEKDGDKNEWLLIPKGTCEKLVGGKLK